MSQPLFSILTPVYNVEKFLPACIESVLAQTLTDWELILVDDGSTDNSGKICDEYAAKYSNKIRVFHNTNHGLIYSRQFALSKMCGGYYIVLDSDDSLVPQTLQTIYNKFQQYQCDCVIYGFEKILPDGQRIYATHDTETYFKDRRSLCKTLFLSHIYNSLWRKAVKSQLMVPKDYGPLERVQMGEDLLQSLDILRVYKTAVLIPDILYRYTVNNTSITQSIYAKPLSVSFEVQAEVLKFLQQEKIFTPQDMQEYHDYCLKIFQQQIKTICSHPASFCEKIKLFKQIKKHPYYTDFLVSNTYKQRRLPFYVQFRLGWYWLLLLEGRLHSFWKRKMVKKYEST